MTRFARFVSSKHSLNLDSYQQLYNWSIENIPQFWEGFWDFADPVASRGFDLVVDDLNKFPGAKWFVGARLNFAENLLRQRASGKTAIVSRNEHSSGAERISYGELYQRVAILANYLRELGLKSGDRVAAYMPNIPSTIIAMLASTSIGATWAACGTELGSSAVLDRIGQITPKILFTVSDYQYKGKRFNLASSVEKLVSEIPSLERVIVFPNNLEEPSDFSTISKSISSKDISGSSNLKFEQLPAEHPLYIMFSSGTTGKPKSIVQSAGGILLNQLKELTLHSDLKEDDIIVYLSSPSWMMWNWVVCSLAVGSTLLVFDGDPNFRDWKTMWKIIEEEKISIFGCSASYINNLRNLDATPKDYDLSKLREISQTGSSLSKEGFEWLYSNVKSDFHFNSISGGTDINGCFAIGNPTIPVYAGEIQAPGLAMKIKSYDENANAVQDKEGELVCEAPSPSMPLCFWNDPNNERYLETYFAFFKGRKIKNVWRHGDYVLFHSDTGGITFYGRSDSVLKPSGVRIGTAEIYNIVEQLPEIADSLAIGQNWKGDQRIILFVKLKQGFELNDELKNKIKSIIREKASPRHVPALIFQSPEIPYTFNMKKVESAVTNLANGRAVTNIDALVNPSSLDYYKNILDKLQG